MLRRPGVFGLAAARAPAAGWTGPTTNLTHRWSLDSTVAGIADLVGSVNGTITGGVTLDSSGVAGGAALACNGTTGYITMGSNPLPALAGAHSAFVWCKITTKTYSPGGSPQSPFGFVEDGTHTVRLCNYSAGGAEDGHVAVAVEKAGNVGDATASAVLVDGTWVHIGYSYSGSAVTAIFVNGSSVSLGGGTGGASAPSGQYVGSKNAAASGMWQGSLYNLAIYSATSDATFAGQVYAAN